MPSRKKRYDQTEPLRRMKALVCDLARKKIIVWDKKKHSDLNEIAALSSLKELSHQEFVS